MVSTKLVRHSTVYSHLIWTFSMYLRKVRYNRNLSKHPNLWVITLRTKKAQLGIYQIQILKLMVIFKTMRNHQIMMVKIWVMTWKRAFRLNKWKANLMKCLMRRRTKNSISTPTFSRYPCLTRCYLKLINSTFWRLSKNKWKPIQKRHQG
jgi:hypothetical protein